MRAVCLIFPSMIVYMCVCVFQIGGVCGCTFVDVRE